MAKMGTSSKEGQDVFCLVQVRNVRIVQELFEVFQVCLDLFLAEIHRDQNGHRRPEGDCIAEWGLDGRVTLVFLRWAIRLSFLRFQPIHSALVHQVKDEDRVTINRENQAQSGRPDS